jgi:hypothetical protein
VTPPPSAAPPAATPPSTAAPVPPGSLTAPASGAEVLEFLVGLGRWITELQASLDDLDAAAQLATHPDTYTAEISLAMSMRQSIGARRDQLVVAYDSGRVGTDERAELARLMWGRLPDALGAPTAFTLAEACTLVTALTDRLRDALSGDAVGGSGVASRILAVRSAIARCRQQADVLGEATTALDGHAAALERAVTGGNRDELRTTVDTVDAAVSAIEGNLIREASMREATARGLADLRRRYDELVVETATVTELAARCRSRIEDPPRLAVPEVSVLGQPPTAPAADARTATGWAAARQALERYGERLQRCGQALDEASTAYAAPLATRDELRGLLGAYRTRAARSGRAEDPTLTAPYEAARDLLWSAPCDLVEARRRVEAYQHAVRVAVGVDRGDADAVPDATEGTP